MYIIELTIIFKNFENGTKIKSFKNKQAKKKKLKVSQFQNDKNKK